MNWIEDYVGNLVNLDHIQEIYIGGHGHDVYGAYEPYDSIVLLFRGNAEESKAYLERIKTRLLPKPC